MTTASHLTALANAVSDPEFRAGIIRRPAYGKMPEMDSLPWQTVVDTLNRLAPGWWHTTTVCDGYVRVDITVADADGVATTRGSLATIAPQIAGGQIPPLETAERTAFKRAASYFGIHLPPGQPRPAGQSDRQAYNPRPQADGNTGGPSPGYCDCGVALTGNYTQCLGCKIAPGRTPGICASCESDCKPEYAQCYNCKRDNAPILPQYQQSTDDAPPHSSVDDWQDVPADVQNHIVSAVTLDDFNGVAGVAVRDAWKSQSWGELAARRLVSAGKEKYFTWDPSDRKFVTSLVDVNELPF